jgi:hypothetical protein
LIWRTVGCNAFSVDDDFGGETQGSLANSATAGLKDGIPSGFRNISSLAKMECFCLAFALPEGTNCGREKI